MLRETPTPPADAPAAVADSPPAPVEPSKSSAPEFFATDHLHDDLKGRSVRGGAATLGGQAANFVLKLGSTAVLARLLTPADFGLIAMVTAVTGFVAMFKDAGLSMATVQRAEIEHGQISTLFWVNLGLSVVLMLVVAALAPGVAWFYGEPCLLAVTLALAALFPLGGLTIQHQALLRRQMRFGTLASIGVASQAIGIAAALTAAAFGARYWALVAMFAASGFANTTLVWLLCPWRPSLPSRRSGVRPMLAFGGNLTGFSFINYFARNADNLLIGWCWGAGALGLYSRAYSLMLLPMSQIKSPLTAVAVPALSRLQDDQERFARFYVRAINGMMWICGPLVAFLAACSEQVILVVLGDQWMAATSVFRVLALIAFFQPVYSTIGWVHVSRGQGDRLLRWSVVACPIMVGAIVAGLPYGPFGVAAAYAAVFLALLPWTLRYAFAGTALTLRALTRSITMPLVVSMAVFAALVFANLLFDAGSAGAQLVVSAMVTAVVFAAVAFAFPGIREELRGMFSLARRLRHSSRHSANCVEMD